jgi:hypothetical protein
MATAMKKCKVCGCEYEYCHTVRRVAGVFRWQDVACSPEHGSIYLARIEASRAGRIAANDAEVVAEKPDYIFGLIEDEDDALFEEDFDDNEAEETAIEK